MRTQKNSDTDTYQLSQVKTVARWVNPKFGDYVDSIYPAELEIKDTNDSTLSASYLVILLEIWQLRYMISMMILISP